MNLPHHIDVLEATLPPDMTLDEARRLRPEDRPHGPTLPPLDTLDVLMEPVDADEFLRELEPDATPCQGCDMHVCECSADWAEGGEW